MSIPIETIINTRSPADDETLADSGFFWRECGKVKVLVSRPLEAAGFVNGFSTRLGGVSPFPAADLNLAGFDEDAAENIYENRRRFLAAFDGDWRLATLWQVHGDTIRNLVSIEDISESEARADSLVSDLEGVLVAVKTADCVPVLIGDPATGAYAAVHAGWRGTVSLIAAKAVESLVRNYGSRPGDMIAALGPAACGRNYEIGQNVIDEFEAKIPDSVKYFTPTRPGHALVDLHQANREQLAAAGVAGTNIFTAPYCTMDRHDLFFSYRIEKKANGKTGRLLAVIGRR